MFDAVIETFGRVDILINFAGINRLPETLRHQMRIVHRQQRDIVALVDLLQMRTQQGFIGDRVIAALAYAEARQEVVDQ